MSNKQFKVVLGFLFVLAIVVMAFIMAKYGNPVYQQMQNVVKTGNFRATPLKKSVLIIYWTRAFSLIPPVNFNPYSWPYFYAGNNCPVDCILTTNKSRINEASAIVVHSRNPREIPPKSLKNVTWLVHTNENPVFTGSLRNPEFMSLFNYLVSYRLDSDFPCPSFFKPSLEPPVPFKKKNGLVVVVLSHCERVRTKYIAELMKHIKVDSYGRCLNNNPRLARASGEEVRIMQKSYKFTIVFPNADCDYYLTEKIYSALSAGSVPVFMGTDKIDEVLQWGNLNHSIIKVKDFSSPKKLAEYLHYLAGNETEYKKYLKWKYEGFNFPKEYYQSAIGTWWDGLPLYCRICMRIAEDPRGHNGLPADKCDGDQKRTVAKWFGEQ